MNKVIFQTKIAPDLQQSIRSQMKLLQYMKDGYVIQINDQYPGGHGWKIKNDSYFYPHMEYRVFEKKKEVTVYTMIYESQVFGIKSFSSTNKEEYEEQLTQIDGIKIKLLKTYVDKVETKLV